LIIDRSPFTPPLLYLPHPLPHLKDPLFIYDCIIE
jgi:hypothetical protein